MLPKPWEPRMGTPSEYAEKFPPGESDPRSWINSYTLGDVTKSIGDIKNNTKSLFQNEGRFNFLDQLLQIRGAFVPREIEPALVLEQSLSCEPRRARSPSRFWLAVPF